MLLCRWKEVISHKSWKNKDRNILGGKLSIQLSRNSNKINYYYDPLLIIPQFLPVDLQVILYLRPGGEGGGGYSGFQVMGMIKGFFGFEIFDSGIFGGRKIWQVFFGGGLI